MRLIISLADDLQPREPEKAVPPDKKPKRKQALTRTKHRKLSYTKEFRKTPKPTDGEEIFGHNDTFYTNDIGEMGFTQATAKALSVIEEPLLIEGTTNEFRSADMDVASDLGPIPSSRLSNSTVSLPVSRAGSEVHSSNVLNKPANGLDTVTNNSPKPESDKAPTSPIPEGNTVQDGAETESDKADSKVPSVPKDSASDEKQLKELSVSSKNKDGLPFEIHEPNAITIAAMVEARSMTDTSAASSSDTSADSNSDTSADSNSDTSTKSSDKSESSSASDSDSADDSTTDDPDTGNDSADGTTDDKKDSGKEENKPKAPVAKAPAAKVEKQEFFTSSPAEAARRGMIALLRANGIPLGTPFTAEKGLLKFSIKGNIMGTITEDEILSYKQFSSIADFISQLRKFGSVQIGQQQLIGAQKVEPTPEVAPAPTTSPEPEVAVMAEADAQAERKISVFLGGTCNNSLWRDSLIALLDPLIVDPFNPVVPDWTEECMQLERDARKNSDYVLYVITPKMTGVYSIAEVVDDSNKQPSKTLFALLPEDEDDAFTPAQIKSLEQVSRMVEANGAKVFKDLSDIASFLNQLDLIR
jgi:hypothetical protein